ncbi:MAG: L-serine ammonia-lyase, iron-sulfur-dependent, subunit alpha [Spirochaetaceae bacterium]|jgi:L-serine dehydratase|nr:L-serine ammonia-lyase, iron-sulfur-dependent, subunit alpha [Spirochaetaceae bacterium]
MPVPLYPDFFNDVFGPVMQPGSAGGFAGPARIGNAARALAGGDIKRVRFLFDKKTRPLPFLVNFMSDRGYLGGIQGFLPDDERLFDAHALARRQGMAYEFGCREEDDGTSGETLVLIEDSRGGTYTMNAASVGGGMILVSGINGFSLEWRADTHLAFLEDPQGRLLPQNMENLAQALFSSPDSSLVRFSAVGFSGGSAAGFSNGSARGRRAYAFEFSSGTPEDSFMAGIGDLGGLRLYRLPALLPVVSRRDKGPQLFTTMEEWRRIAGERGISFVDAAIAYEKNSSRWTEKQIWDFFENIAGILYNQIHSLEEIGYEEAKDTDLLPIYGRYWNRYAEKNRIISDGLTGHIIRHALSTNAKIPGVKIVPAPMGTGGGYLFSALDAVREQYGISHERMVESLVVAAGLGALAFTHTNASGEVGCVGESGVCCAMASGAIAWLCGGDGQAVENAASMALQANIGIPCDPIAGGLEFPCITRTIRAAVTAPLYADLALSGINPLIPYHEMLGVIEKTHKTATGDCLSGPHCGCNMTAAAEACNARLEAASIAGLHFVPA